uniref:Zinc finger protein RFP-like n=1 Tax=Calidris pygmaea TaxID=425635 RepID=A0A8C3JH04_9CHAR
MTPLEMLQDESCCSICLEIFQDPVSIHCGHSFCRSCITRTWEGRTTNFSCPQCRETVARKTLRPNWELANMIEAAKGLNLQTVREVEGGGNFCEKHQEPLKLFCQDDKRLLCVVCDRSKVHRDHSVVPMDEAVQECKVRGVMGVHGGAKFCQHLPQEPPPVASAEGARPRCHSTGDFFLSSQKQIQTQLYILKSEQEALQSSMKDRQDRLKDHTVGAHQFSWAEGGGRKEEQGPSQVRGMGGERKSPLASKSAAMSLTLSPPPAQMTLDPETANPSLYLSEDCKLVRWERCKQDLPSNPGRFKFHPCVLGSRGFTSGWHCWEVEVHREGSWALGVVKESVPRGHGLCLKPDEGVWALRHTHDGYEALTSPYATPLTLHSVPKRIQICLDYEKGRVVFFDAETPPTSHPLILAFPSQQPLPSIFLPLHPLHPQAVLSP